MRIPSNHSTSIDDLLNKGTASVFLSDWSGQEKSQFVEQNLILKSLTKASSNANQYFFIDELQESKAWLSDAIYEASGLRIAAENMAISSNGTATTFLLIYILNKNTKLKVLLFTPIYFSYIKLLDELSIDVSFMQIINGGKASIDFQKLESTIEENDINLIILNDPIFGAGIPINEEDYRKLSLICTKHEVTLMIDYIYGGMEWEHPISVVNGFLANLASESNHVLVVESISKRIFLNGVKTSLVFSEPNIIRQFEASSVHTIGTLTSPQISILKELYDPLNVKSVLNLVEGNKNAARNNYSLLQTLLMGSDLFLSDCSSGYFCLIHVPYKLLSSESDSNVAAEFLIEKIGILTIPHDRYLYFCETYYSFRINLSTPQSILATSISKLLSICGS